MNSTQQILQRLARLEAAAGNDDDQKLGTVAVANRYDTSVRTVDRWTKDPALDFPQPMFINKRKYWSLNALKQWDRKQSARGRGRHE
jgi:hypothetical protein